MTNRPWLPPFLTDDDIDAAVAANQPHMRTLARTATLIEDKHDEAILLGLPLLHDVLHDKLNLVEDMIDRGIKAQWS